jgi:hypothetical protein
MIFDIMSTGKEGKRLGLKDCVVSAKGRLSLLPSGCPNTPAPVSPHIRDPSVNQTYPLTLGEVPVPEVQSSLVNATILYLGSKL